MRKWYTQKKHNPPYKWTDAETEAYYRAALEEARYMSPTAYDMEDVAEDIEPEV